MKITESKLRSIIRDIILENNDKSTKPKEEEIKNVLDLYYNMTKHTLKNENVNESSVGEMMHAGLKTVTYSTMTFAAASILFAITQKFGIDISAITPEMISEYASTHEYLYHLMIAVISATASGHTSMLHK